MRFTQLGAVAALAGLSQGFLIPPEISSADKDIITILPFEEAVGLGGRAMELQCMGCVVASDPEGKRYGAQAESMLQLNFSLSHNNGADQLMLNEFQIYPMLELGSVDFRQGLTAPQMVKSADGTWQYASTTELGYGVVINHPGGRDQEQMGLVTIHLDIIQVADQFVSGLPTVDLQLLETPSGKLMIGAAGISVPQTPSAPTDDAQECTTMLCKWRAIAADRLKAMKGAIAKGCGKKQPSHVSVVAPDHGVEILPVFVPKRPLHYGSTRPHGSHRGHRHRRPSYRVARFFRGIVLHVFLPVLIGIMVGITASLIGMVVGHIAIFTWRMLFRRGQSKYAEVKQEEAGEEFEDDTKGSLEHEVPPPQYEDAVVEKKEESA